MAYFMDGKHSTVAFWHLHPSRFHSFFHSAFLLFHFRLINSIVKINLQWFLLLLYLPLEVIDIDLNHPSICPVSLLPFFNRHEIFMCLMYSHFCFQTVRRQQRQVQLKFPTPFEQRKGEWKSSDATRKYK